MYKELLWIKKKKVNSQIKKLIDMNRQFSIKDIK